MRQTWNPFPLNSKWDEAVAVLSTAATTSPDKRTHGRNWATLKWTRSLDERRQQAELAGFNWFNDSIDDCPPPLFCIKNFFTFVNGWFPELIHHFAENSGWSILEIVETAASSQLKNTAEYFSMTLLEVVFRNARRRLYFHEKWAYTDFCFKKGRKGFLRWKCMN